jgi:uncharacterized membrane protein YedE/YeeE
MSTFAHFSPWTSLAGGLMIGVAVSILIVFNGRIAGISGIVGSLLKPSKNEMAWRWAFILGLIIAPIIYGLLTAMPEVEVSASHWQLILAGLLVGIGTRYASGCTSGHGICGIARLSRRSIAATLLFMASGMAVVYVMRHVIGA